MRHKQREKMLLVCADADAPFTIHPGTVFDHQCSRCGCKVMISPSGQRALREHGAAIQIVCQHCFQPQPGDTFETAATPAELRAELKGVVANRRARYLN